MKAALSTGADRDWGAWESAWPHTHVCETKAEAEARALLSRTEPKAHGCHHRTLAQVANTPAFLARLGITGPDVAANATFALQEALAAFVMAEPEPVAGGRKGPEPNKGIGPCGCCFSARAYAAGFHMRSCRWRKWSRRDHGTLTERSIG